MYRPTLLICFTLFSAMVSSDTVDFVIDIEEDIPEEEWRFVPGRLKYVNSTTELPIPGLSLTGDGIWYETGVNNGRTGIEVRYLNADINFTLWYYSNSEGNFFLEGTTFTFIPKSEGTSWSNVEITLNKDALGGIYWKPSNDNEYFILDKIEVTLDRELSTTEISSTIDDSTSTSVESLPTESSLSSNPTTDSSTNEVSISSASTILDESSSNPTSDVPTSEQASTISTTLVSASTNQEVISTSTKSDDSSTSSIFDTTELESSSTTSISDTTELESSSTTSIPNTTELEDSSTTDISDATDLESSSTTSIPDTTELEDSSITYISDITDLESSSTTSIYDTTDLEKSSTTSVSDTTELEDSSTTDISDTTELQNSSPQTVDSTITSDATSSSSSTDDSSPSDSESTPRTEPFSSTSSLIPSEPISELPETTDTKPTKPSDESSTTNTPGGGIGNGNDGLETYEYILYIGLPLCILALLVGAMTFYLHLKSKRAATKAQSQHRTNQQTRQGPMIESSHPPFNSPLSLSSPQSQNYTFPSTAAAAASYRSPEYYSYKEIVNEQSKPPKTNYVGQPNAKPRRILFSHADSQTSIPTSPTSVGNYSYVSPRFRKQN